MTQNDSFILPTVKGRGASVNPKNRFEKLAVEFEPDVSHIDPNDPEEAPPPQTVYYKDASRSIIATNDSPDVGFTHSINPYRGCAHGCIYCYARQTHEYLGFSSGLDFETKIMVKADAPELLRKELSNPKWKPTTLSISGVTDCYQPIERQLQITRKCLEVLAECRNPCGIVTKNHLVTRDIDLLAALARHQASVVLISVTTLDKDLARTMEPRTSSPRRRLEAIEMIANAGIPVGVMVAPVIPGLTDHEMPSILKSAADAGAGFAGYVPVRLPLANKDLFEDWLSRHYPDRKDKILNRIRGLRGGKLNDSGFHSRMQGEGIWSEQLKTVFEMAKKRAGMTGSFPHLSADAFRRPSGPQMMMFE